MALSQIRIYTLGQFRLERRDSRDAQDWQTVTDSSWQHQRVRLLLAGLVSNSVRRVGREQLLELFWPELEREVASSRLDRAVYSLRQLFEPLRTKSATSPLLLIEGGLLVLGEHPQVWVDADVFERLINEAREIGEKDLGKKESLLVEAMSLYGGAFLPEMRKSEWTQSRRELLLHTLIGLLLDLSDVCSKRDSWVGALEPLNKLLSLDPTNEPAVQRMMLLLSCLERRGEALQAYKQLAGVLQREFNIAPLPETRAIYEKMRSGNLPDKPAMTNQQDALKEQRHISPLLASLFGRSHVNPLVGRREEINLLGGMLKEIEGLAKFRLPGQKKSITSPLNTQRRPQCVMLMGELGIGKTRLVEEVSHEAKRGNWAVAWSRVYAQEGSIPYRLWTEVLRRSLEQGLWQRQEMQRRSTLLQPLTALLPDLQEYFPSSFYLPAQSPEREQLRMWEAALELLTMISENTPLVIALDDLQWADQNSCELLAYLARRINGYPIFIIGTCRENELTPNHALRSLLTDLLREHAVESVPLQPLDSKEIEALVSYIPHLPGTMVQRICELEAIPSLLKSSVVLWVQSRPSTLAPTAAMVPMAILPTTPVAILLCSPTPSPPCLICVSAVLAQSARVFCVKPPSLDVPLNFRRLPLWSLAQSITATTMLTLCLIVWKRPWHRACLPKRELARASPINSGIPCSSATSASVSPQRVVPTSTVELPKSYAESISIGRKKGLS